MFRKTKKGFTVVEALIVMAILAVIAVILIPLLISNIDKSAAQKDESMMDEVVNAVRLSVAEDDIFDEALHYSVRNNFLTYTDSDGSYGTHVKDSEFWAPDGSGRAMTITFNPIQEGNKWVYNLGNGYVNDMTYGNGSTINPARTMTGCEAYPAQVYFRAMSYNDITVSSRLYNRVVQSVGEVLELSSHTYEHSSYTIFIMFTQKDGITVATVTGSFNGTNLDSDSLAATGSGTTDYDDNGNPNGNNSGTTSSNYDSSDLVGGGHVTYRTYPTYEGDYLDKDKFLAFCAANASDSITNLRIYASGTSEGVDVSHNGSGTILAWVDGHNMNIGYVNAGYQILLPVDASYMFAADSTGLHNLTTIDMDNASTQQTELMVGIFQNNKKAEVIAIDGWSCANCTNLSYAFYNCEKVKNIRVAAWNTSNVENMSYTFANCNTITKLNTENWVTNKVKNMQFMFAGCTSLDTINVSKFKTSLVESMESMFEGCSSVKTLDIKKFDVSYSRSLKNMFKDCTKVEVLDMTEWDTSSCTDMGGMFYNCKAVKELNLASFNTELVKDMSYMFYKCQQIEMLDISNFDNLNCPSVTHMFDGMVRLEEITLSSKYSFAGNGIDRCFLPEPSSLYIDGANGTWMNDLGQSFPYDKVPNKVAATYYAVDTSTPATLAPKDIWWRGSTPKSNIRTIIVINSYTSNSYDEVFNADVGNEGDIKVYVEGNIAYLVNLKNKRSTKAFLLSEDASNMFSGFVNLRTISGLKLINTINVKNMDNFFGKVVDGSTTGCMNLTYASGIETWNVQNLQTAKEMFAGVGLQSINLTEWQTPNLANAAGMFYNTAATSINLTGWDVGDVTNFNYMFANSGVREIILGGWAPKQSATFTDMFAECPFLTMIQTSPSFRVNNQSISMFEGSTSIQGNRGTTYVDDLSKYAHVDVDGDPGYFTSSEIQGTVTARLYNSGTVSGSYTELTASGATPPAWDFYSGPRLLEVNVASMARGVQKTVTISVPAGMYIVADSWTGIGGNVENVEFTPLDINPTQSGLQQGTGSYKNTQTGTLTYTFPTYTTAATVKCLVMFDKAVWNKDKSNASYGTTYLTVDPPVVVDYNGYFIKKIKNITSAAGIGGGSQGYSFYYWTTTGRMFENQNQTLIGNCYWLSSDQSTMPYYWKEVTYECWATSTNAAGQTIYVDIKGLGYAGTGSKSSESTVDNVYKCSWTNLYVSSSLGYPRVTFNLDPAKGFVVGKTVTLYQKFKTVSFSGQIREETKTSNFTITSSAPNYNMFSISGSGLYVPPESYYEDSGLCDVMGLFAATNTGVATLDGMHFSYLYDELTPQGTAPVAKVQAARVACPGGKGVTMQVTLVDENGTFKGPYAVSGISTANVQGIYVSAANVAANNGLSGTYFLKQIDYDAPPFPGGLTYQYYYNSGGSEYTISAGIILGTTSANARHRLTLTCPGQSPRTVYSNSYVNTGFRTSGLIPNYDLPLGSTVTAGDNIELDLQVQACDYSYVESQAFSRPEIYIILPFGVNVEGAIIGNSKTATASEATPEVTRIKSVEVNGVLSYVYRIRFTQKTWFGYVKAGLASAGSNGLTSKWIRIMLSTDSSLPTTTINIRSSVYFKDVSSHTYVGGGYASWLASDPYDVDNDGSTSDTYGTIKSEWGDRSIIINEVD